jgi:hypothetical protein
VQKKKKKRGRGMMVMEMVIIMGAQIFQKFRSHFIILEDTRNVT